MKKNQTYHSQVQLRLTNRDTGEVICLKIKSEYSDPKVICCFAINEHLKEGDYLVEIM